MVNTPGFRALCCAGVFAMFVSKLHAGAGDSPVEQLLSAARPLVIGHRGYCSIAPENTLPSFKLAKAAGADMVELDYYHTKDGELIVIHDPTLDRTTDAVAKWGGSKIGVETKTLAELKTLDAGKWFDPQFAGTRLPTLKEALELIQAGNVTLIERKGGDAAACIKLLSEQKLINRVIVHSFDWNYLAEFHQQEPRQVLSALGPLGYRDGKKLTEPEKFLSERWVDDAVKSGVRAMGWNAQVTKESVAYAHRQELKIWIYTIDDPAEANRLLDLGVDGIITNNTSLIWRAIALRGGKTPT
jgi:glycerophosphoryl diester phosphodiesterase